MPGFAFGAGLTLTICEDCISDKIVVRGTNDLTNNISEYTFLTVKDPNGNEIWSATFSKGDSSILYKGSFTTKFSTNNNNFSHQGEYTITASPCTGNADNPNYAEKCLPYIVSKKLSLHLISSAKIIIKSLLALRTPISTH